MVHRSTCREKLRLPLEWKSFILITVKAVESERPSIEVVQVEQSRSLNPGRWLFRWRVENKTEKAMRLVSVRVPHGKFKADERKFGPAAKIAAQDSFILDLAAAFKEPPNTIIENAFLILLVDWQENSWRFFVRLRIKVDHQGHPETATESITVQQVGFSVFRIDG
jgi:hypothetical protein